MMKCKGLLVISLITVTCLIACRRKDDSGLGIFKGIWVAQQEDELWIEKWDDTATDDILLHGYSSVVSDSDTSVMEKLQIIKSGDSLIYRATVFNQNGALPVDFKLVRKEKGFFRFENPLHDYPQFLEYSFRHEDSLVVTIGLIGDNAGDFTFSFARKKD